MPHITIEHSANVAAHHDVQRLVDDVHQAAFDHGLAGRDALRTRAIPCDHFRVADGSDDFAFVAIEVRIGPGRGTDEQTSFIATLLDAAEASLQPTDLAIAWSIELRQLDPQRRINRNRVRERMQQHQEDA